MAIVRGVRKMVKSIFLQDGEEIFVDDDDAGDNNIKATNLC